MKNKKVKVFDLACARHKSFENVCAKSLLRGSDLKARIDWADVSTVLELIEFTPKRIRQNNSPDKKETYSSVPRKRDVRHHLYT